VDGSVNPKLLNGGYGISIKRKGSEILAKCCPLANHTINKAEATGLVNGLNEAIMLGIRRLTVYSDSKIVIQLCNDEGVCTSPNLLHIFSHIQELKKRFDEIYFIHVFREHNTRADVLAFTACNNPGMMEEVIHNPNSARPVNVVDKPFPHIAVVPQKFLASRLTISKTVGRGSE
jgi:ribonuclease HI